MESSYQLPVEQDEDQQSSDSLLDPMLDQDGERMDDPPPSSSRLFRVAASLLQVHVQIAKQELLRDQGRLFRGALLLALGVLLGATVAGLLQVLGVLLLHGRGLSWPLAILAMAGGDAVLGLLLCYLGARSLRQPVMPQTRAQVKRTLNAILLP